MLRGLLVLGSVSGASALCNASALPYTATPFDATAEQEAFNAAVLFVNSTFNTNSVPIVLIQGALMDANQGYSWMMASLPTHVYAAQADGRSSCLIDSLRLLYAEDTTLYQVRWATTSGLHNPLLTPLDPGLPSVLATALGLTAGTPAIADAVFMALIVQADALETFTAKFATAAPTAPVLTIQAAVSAVMTGDLIAAATAMTPGLLLALAGDTLGAVKAFKTVYAATPEYYRILWNFTPLSAALTGSSDVPDLSVLLPSTLNPGYPTALATAMGLDAPADISAGFEQVIWVLTLTQRYYTEACCPWPMESASAECLAALATCTYSFTAIQDAIQDDTEGIGVLVPGPAATAMQSAFTGLGMMAAGDFDGLFVLAMDLAVVYRDTPIYCAPPPHASSSMATVDDEAVSGGDEGTPFSSPCASPFSAPFAFASSGCGCDCGSASASACASACASSASFLSRASRMRRGMAARSLRFSSASRSPCTRLASRSEPTWTRTPSTVPTTPSPSSSSNSVHGGGSTARDCAKSRKAAAIGWLDTASTPAASCIARSVVVAPPRLICSRRNLPSVSVPVLSRASVRIWARSSIWRDDLTRMPQRASPAMPQAYLVGASWG